MFLPPQVRCFVECVIFPEPGTSLPGFLLRCGKAVGIFHIGRDGISERIAAPDHPLIEQRAVCQTDIGEQPPVAVVPFDIKFKADSAAVFLQHAAEITLCPQSPRTLSPFRSIHTDQPDEFPLPHRAVLAGERKGVAVYNADAHLRSTVRRPGSSGQQHRDEKAGENACIIMGGHRVV